MQLITYIKNNNINYIEKCIKNVYFFKIENFFWFKKNIEFCGEESSTNIYCAYIVFRGYYATNHKYIIIIDNVK